MEVLIFVGFHDSVTTATFMKIVLLLMRQKCDSPFTMLLHYIHTNSLFFILIFIFIPTNTLNIMLVLHHFSAPHFFPIGGRKIFHLLYCVLLFPRVLITHLYKAFLVFLALLQFLLSHIIFFIIPSLCFLIQILMCSLLISYPMSHICDYPFM